MTTMDKLRMFQWVVIASALYFAATQLARHDLLPQLQIVLWKLGHITLAAFTGYWIDRQAFLCSRLGKQSPAGSEIRRAIIIGAAMLAIAMGM
jgi:hypothetical protein